MKSSLDYFLEQGRTATASEVIDRIRLDMIDPSPYQARRSFDDASIKELADSIRENGLIQPITVRSHPEHPERYQLVAGERRLRACRLLGETDIAAQVVEIDEQRLQLVGLVENIQRESLTLWERANAYRAVQQTLGLSVNATARALGLSQPAVRRTLAVLDIDHETLELIDPDAIGAHAVAALARLAPSARLALAQRIAREGLGGQTIEHAVERLLHRTVNATAANARATRRDPNIVALESRVSDHLGAATRLTYQPKTHAGRMVIHFKGLDQLDGLIDKLGLHDE